MGRLSLAAALAVALLCAIAGAAQARETYSAAEVKAVFLYRFTGYVTWPERALSSPYFTIAVLGADDVAEHLEILVREHRIHDHPARVRRVRDVAQAADAQVLYVGPGHDGELQRLIAALHARPTLVVTDDDYGLDAGGTVNFLLRDRRVRFEISLAAANQSGLKISSDLLSVATRVHRGGGGSDAACDRFAPPAASEWSCALRIASHGWLRAASARAGPAGRAGRRLPDGHS